MLPWLILALLWSPTCCAQQTFGPGGGTYFNTSRDFQNNITRISVFTGHFGCVRSIQVRYSSSSSEKYGVPGGITQELLLQQGEHIVRIHRSYTKYLQSLLIYNSFAASRDEIEKVLTGVYGQYTVQSITRISFDRNYPSN
uniref:Jacalin-type lectin domain-containing protein n=1 Tax=Moschus moschiferus TaxID=68415 RepID=A0A8C6DEK2_MOSMO